MQVGVCRLEFAGWSLHTCTCLDLVWACARLPVAGGHKSSPGGGRAEGRESRGSVFQTRRRAAEAAPPPRGGAMEGVPS